MRQGLLMDLGNAAGRLTSAMVPDNTLAYTYGTTTTAVCGSTTDTNAGADGFESFFPGCAVPDTPEEKLQADEQGELQGDMYG
jgi:hypothetical protein